MTNTKAITVRFLSTCAFYVDRKKKRAKMFAFEKDQQLAGVPEAYHCLMEVRGKKRACEVFDFFLSNGDTVLCVPYGCVRISD